MQEKQESKKGKQEKYYVFILWQNKTYALKYAYHLSAPVFEQKILTMHLFKLRLLFMEVSTICGSFIYGEGQEELVIRGRYKAKKEKKEKKTRKESQKKC